LRIQRKEDGLAIDQIVISSYAFLYGPPGQLKNDGTILQSTLGVAPAPTPTPTPTPANVAPSVSISASPTSGNSPLFVTFSSSAHDSDGFITSYSWTFGNGATSSVPNPTVTYQSAGTYTARLTVTDDDGASSSATVQINVSSPTLPTSGTLRVLSWNVAFGKGTDNIQNWDRIANWIKNMNPDLVGLCEMPSQDISTLVSLVSQKTGRTWYSHHLAKYVGTTEGNLILSKYPFNSTNGRYLSYQRSVAQASVTIAGRTISFFATHLDPDSSGIRYTQVGELMSFMSAFGEQRIAVGDFNAGPDTSESVRMTSGYYDSWMRALNAGTATAYPDNPLGMHTRTRRGRIDYVFYSHSAGGLVLTGTQIPDTRDLSNTKVVVYLGTLDDKGVRPSDHNPMIAKFNIQ
jgi:endonuclease/exonuclease/phosphatase family metal-dependent hydrolase